MYDFYLPQMKDDNYETISSISLVAPKQWSYVVLRETFKEGLQLFTNNDI